MLKETKGYANFRGRISGLKRKGAIQNFAFGTKLSFFINTSETNSILVELMAFTNRTNNLVYASKFEDGKYVETKGFKFEDRHDLPEGFRIIGTDIKAKNDEVAKSMVEVDAIHYILDHFKDGDSVFIGTAINRSAKGDKVYTNYGLKRMYLADDVDFKADDFAEISEFNEECVFVKATPFGEMTLVEAKTISYGQKTSPVTYVIRHEFPEDKELSKYILNSLKFGDMFKALGIVHNRAETQEVKDDNKQFQPDGVIGGAGRLNSFNPMGRKTNIVLAKDRLVENQLLAIKDIKQGIYNEEDFGGNTPMPKSEPVKTDDTEEFKNFDDVSDDEMPDWLSMK